MPKKRKYKKIKKDDGLPLIAEEKPLLSDAEQEKAIAHKDGPLLIVAGAGTGKTRVITERIARLINDKACEPSEILALTFSEKAAKEMEKRVDELVPYGMIDAHISTFHSFGRDIIDESFAELRIAPDWKIITEADAIIMIVQNIDSFDLDIYKPLNNPAQYLKGMVDFISKLKDNLITPQMYAEFTENFKADTDEDKEVLEKHRELSGFYSKYEQLKTAKNLLDYGDLILVPYYLLKEKKSVLAKYTDRFKYVLVDEFQDTNYAQFEFVKLIADKNRNIAVVGDDDQMIYRFRGAAISNIKGFKDYYKDAEVIVLKNNYRSEQSILDAAYTLIQNNEDRLESLLDIEKKLVSKYKPAHKIHHMNINAFEHYSEEADFVAKEIKKMVDNNYYNYKDIAILVRAKANAKMFMNTLESKGIPFVFSGDEGLFNKPEVQFFINFCRSLATPYEFNPLFDVAISEYYNISPFTMSKINNRSKDYSITTLDMMKSIEKYPELELDEGEIKKVKRLVNDVDRYIDLVKQDWGAGEILYDFVKTKRVFEGLLKEKTTESELKIINISRFFDIIKKFTIDEEYNTVPRFVEYIDLKQKAGENPQADILSMMDEDAVQVVTVHKAKGLEYKVVFVIGLIEGRFPVRARGSYSYPLPESIMHDLVDEKKYMKEEERRLFYVAMTRAQDALYLTCSKQYEGTGDKKVSVFLKEIGVKDPDSHLVKMDRVEKLKFFEKYKKATEKFIERKPDDMLVLSNYQIDDYLTCPYKYKLIHLLKMPIRENPAIIYGQAMHKVASEYYRAKQEKRKISEKDLVSIFEAMWKPVGFLSRDHEKKRFEKGLETIKKFFSEEEKKNIIPKYIEKSFDFKLANDLAVVGRWDRIDVTDGRVTILDYKTSDVRDFEKAKKKLTTGDIPKQLNLYAMAYEKVFKKLPEEAGVYFIESAIVAVKKVNKKTLENHEKKIFEVAGAIKKGDFEAAPGSFSCSQCAFSTICQYSKADVLF